MNKLVNKTLSGESQVISTSGNEIDFSIMAKIHKKNLKYVEKTIQGLREKSPPSWAARRTRRPP